MDHCLMLEPQEGWRYQDIASCVLRAEAAGFVAAYRSDHFMSVRGDEDAWSSDAWTTLAGLARDTTSIALGTLVTPTTFRTFGALAKSVATVMDMASPGQEVHLGLGTGWLAREHEAFGLRFGDLNERYRRLEEYLAGIRALWSDESHVSSDGDHVRLSRAPHLGVAGGSRPRLIIGGSGLHRTPRLAVRYADELNVPYSTVAHCKKVVEQVRRYEDDPEVRRAQPIVVSAMTGCIIGRTEGEFLDRAGRLQRVLAPDESLDDFLANREDTWLLGTRADVASRLASLAEVGVTRLALTVDEVDDIDMIDTFADWFIR